MTLPRGAKPLRPGQKLLLELGVSIPRQSASQAPVAPSGKRLAVVSVHRLRCPDCGDEGWHRLGAIPHECGACGSSLPVRMMGSVTGTDVENWVLS